MVSDMTEGGTDKKKKKESRDAPPLTTEEERDESQHNLMDEMRQLLLSDKVQEILILREIHRYTYIISRKRIDDES